MPYSMFYACFPDVAERETRTILVPAGSDIGLPADEYGFIELYCNEPGCDCRRVFWQVMSRQRQDAVAVVAWGWEPRAFYAKWMHSDNARDIDELKGPVLNLASPQSELAPAILNLVENALLKDAAYVERVRRHYRMFREQIDGGGSRKPQLGRPRR